MPRVIGIEVAERTIRAVEISQGRHPQLLAAGEVPLPEGAAKDSEVVDVDAVALAVRQLWAQAGLRGKRVVLGVSNRRILVREYVSPRLAPELLRAALPYEVQDLLPVPVEQAVLDFYPVSETDSHILGLLVAAVAETIEGLIGTLATAKIQTEAVDFIPFGLARLLRSVAPAEPGAVALASIGDHTTNVVVSSGGVPRFVRIIPVDLDAELLAPVGAAPVAEPGAEGWVARRALAEVAPLPPTVAPVADLVGRLRSTLRFYAGREGAEPVTRLYLTGSALGAPGLIDQVAAGLELPVVPIGVTEVIGVSKALAAQGPPPPSLMNALGVACGVGK